MERAGSRWLIREVEQPVQTVLKERVELQPHWFAKYSVRRLTVTDQRLAQRVLLMD